MNNRQSEDNNEGDVFQIFAQNLEKMRQAQAKKNPVKPHDSVPGKRTLFIGPTFDAERADRIAKVMFPKLAEIFPESLKDESHRKDLFGRMFKRKEAYITRQWVRNLYNALRNFNWTYLTSKDGPSLNQKEKEILLRSDSKRHKFMDIIKEITGISV